MKNSQKGTYIGAGTGLVGFALAGLLPGSLLGGALGINLAGAIFGLPLESGIIARLIVLASMLLGVLVAGIVWVVTTSSIGYIMGSVLDTLKSKVEVYHEEHNS